MWDKRYSNIVLKRPYTVYCSICYLKFYKNATLADLCRVRL